jgi:hypothetical protein
MTRINVVSPKELSNAWLISEYRELPRCIKQDISTENAPINYVLGKGHVAWARSHLLFLIVRYFKLCAEMRYRGFKVNNSAWRLLLLMIRKTPFKLWKFYKVTDRDIKHNQKRLSEKYRANRKAHRWALRNKPYWM